MAARSACASLLGRVRSLLGVELNNPLLPSDEEQQTVLDLHRETVGEEELYPVRTIAPDAYIEWQAKRGGFDTAAKILNMNDNRAVLESADFTEADPVIGSWSLTTGAAADITALSITGRRYDVHGAAADLGERMLAMLRASAVDVTDADASLKRNQQITTLQAVISGLRARQWVRSVPASRSDVSRIGKY